MSIKEIEEKLAELPPDVCVSLSVYGQMLRTSDNNSVADHSAGAIHGVAETVRAFGFEEQADLIHHFAAVCSAIADGDIEEDPS